MVSAIAEFPAGVALSRYSRQGESAEMVPGWRGAIADILIAGANPAPLEMLERCNGGYKDSDWAT